MPPTELGPDSEPSVPTLGRRRARTAIVGVVGVSAGAVGYAVAAILGCATTCATGRSPMTFALLIGCTAAIAAASGVAHRR